MVRPSAMTDQPRVPAGSPEGGQFASKNARYGRYTEFPATPPKGHNQPSERQVEELIKYQDNSNYINNSLRRDIWPHGYEHLDKAVAANPLEHKVLYRVIDKAFHTALITGVIIQDKAFLSTTSSAEAAKLMCGNEPGKAVLKINAPSGRRALDMNRVQAVAGLENPYKELEEILLERNTRLKITSVTNDEIESEWL
jgi:hypothetical protein